MFNLDVKLPQYEEEVRGAKLLPEPTGYRLLVALPELEEKTGGGVFIPKSRIDKEEVGSVVGFVLKAGSLAYKDNDKFPDGPWCKEGDWVIFRAYSGTRIKIHGREFRIITDTTVEAVVEDPRGVSRV